MGMFKRKNKLKLEYNENQLIVIRPHRSEWGEVSGLVLLLGGLFAMGYYSDNKDKLPVYLILSTIGIPLLILLYNSIKLLISKDHLVFSKMSQSIHRKEKIVATFQEVDHVEWRAFIASDTGENNYLLNLRLRNKSSIEIDNKLDKAEIKKVSEAIGAFLNKEIKKK